ncbi:hypothetical protein, partial [Candidatus Methanoperedens nitratireducens]|uniref:hypothetical protein n=1 Tax=Candidatus Methanoperedens nitratireducens TaxID=1392998 RepID=UPI001178A39C
MKFEILKEESFNLDFVKDVLKNTNNPHRDKYLEVFNSEGLSTDKYKFHDIWEDFAEFILSNDFEICKINRDIGVPWNEKTQELSSKYRHKRASGKNHRTAYNPKIDPIHILFSKEFHKTLQTSNRLNALAAL